LGEKTRIISVELKNYRQYYGTQKIEFSSREEGFTTILGESGHGKSNLLNAINWCFYKDEPHGKKESDTSSPVINTSYLLEQKVGTTARTSVRVVLQIGDRQYSITRVLTVLIGDIEYEKLEDGTPVMMMSKWDDNKIPEGCEVVDSETVWKIKKKDKGQTDFSDIKEDIGYKMNQILPKRLSVFFLLDGEFLEKFWDNFERVEEGIEEISHLHLLNAAVDHVGDVSISRTTRTGSGSEKDTLQKLINHNRYYEKSLGEDGNILLSEKPRWVQLGQVETGETYHATGTPRVKDLEHDIKKMQRRSQDISREISGVNAASAKILQKQFEETEEELKTAKTSKREAENRWRNSLVDKSVYVFAKGALDDSVKIIESHLKQGDLPNETKTTFTSDLLERGTCICDTNLKSNLVDGKETNQFRIAVMREKDRVSQDIGLDSAVSMRFSFKNKVLDDYEGFLKTTFGDLEKVFKTSDENQDKINRKLKGIKDQLGAAGDKKIQDLICEQDQLIEEIKTATEERQNIEVTLSKKSNENDTNQQKIIRLFAKDSKAAREIHQTKIWNKAREQLKIVYDEMKTETRIDMQEKTWEIFKQILLESEEFKKFVIKKDYQCVITNQDDADQLVDLSAGQSLFLALSFVTALREITGYSFPLVIDSPLGKISGTNRYNLAKVLPDYLKEEQLTFLATDTEWISDIPDMDATGRGADSFAELLEQKIPIKHFKISKKKGRSEISRIELKEIMNNDK
jgi:DNA sulfur modification protein DndD